jgi:hypothetical protein
LYRVPCQRGHKIKRHKSQAKQKPKSANVKAQGERMSKTAIFLYLIALWFFPITLCYCNEETTQNRESSYINFHFVSQDADSNCIKMTPVISVNPEELCLEQSPVLTINDIERVEYKVPLITKEEKREREEYKKEYRKMFGKDAGDMFQKEKEQYVIELIPEGKKKLLKITTENIGKRLGLVVDGKLFWAPMLRSPIETGEISLPGELINEETLKQIMFRVNQIKGIEK